MSYPDDDPRHHFFNHEHAAERALAEGNETAALVHAQLATGGAGLAVFDAVLALRDRLESVERTLKVNLGDLAQ